MHTLACCQWEYIGLFHKRFYRNSKFAEFFIAVNQIMLIRLDFYCIWYVCWCIMYKIPLCIDEFDEYHLYFVERFRFFFFLSEHRNSQSTSCKAYFTKGVRDYNWNLVKNSYRFKHHSYDPIRSQICTCPDSSAIVACAKLWPDLITIIKARATWNFMRFGLWALKAFVNRFPRLPSLLVLGLSWSACKANNGRESPQMCHQVIVVQTFKVKMVNTFRPPQNGCSWQAAVNVLSPKEKVFWFKFHQNVFAPK